MNRKNRYIHMILLCVLMEIMSTGAQAQEPPKMPYAFEKNCFLCHRSPERTGPIGIYNLLSKSGNPLHEQYIRSNVRFGYNAMPAFRISEISPKELNAIVDYLKTVASYRKIHPEYKPAPVQEGKVKK